MATHVEAEAAHGRAQVRSTSGVNLVLGAWLIVSPFVLATADSAAWNNVVFGFAIVIFAAVRVVWPVASSRVSSWTNVAIGVWIVASPFAFDFVMSAAVWNNVIVGALVVCFALWGSTRPRAAPSTERRVSTRAPGQRHATPVHPAGPRRQH